MKINQTTYNWGSVNGDVRPWIKRDASMTATQGLNEPTNNVHVGELSKVTQALLETAQRFESMEKLS